MNSKANDILALLDQEDYFSALSNCQTLIENFQTKFMEELTVNTATDYVGAVILYSRICAAVKKPWKSFPHLETARGALRFLKDFMADSDMLAETYDSFGDAFARGTYLPEAVSCFCDAAGYFASDDKSMDALYSAFFYQARFGKKLLRDLSFAEERFGKAKLAQLKAQAEDEANAQIKMDGVESSDEFLKIRFEVEKITDELLAQNRDSDEPFCLLYWNTKKSVLKERFDIDWKTPAEMNPNIRFY